jgi:prolyl oligopeptidase
MISRDAVLRVARPTDQLQAITKMYIDGLGFALLGRFHDHDGFDGAIIGHPAHPWHLEFTQHHGVSVGGAPTRDNLLVFYVPDRETWSDCCARMRAAGFREVPSYNLYWDRVGCTFEDLDGYRVVIQNAAWEK